VSGISGLGSLAFGLCFPMNALVCRRLTERQRPKAKGQTSKTKGQRARSCQLPAMGRAVKISGHFIFVPICVRPDLLSLVLERKSQTQFLLPQSDHNIDRLLERSIRRTTQSDVHSDATHQGFPAGVCEPTE